MLSTLPLRHFLCSFLIVKSIPKEFENEIEKFDGKFIIIRLHKSGKGRIIGKLVNKVFYIFYIDVKGKLYKHWNKNRDSTIVYEATCTIPIQIFGMKFAISL